jgi:DNA-binding PadR family transcriptional regulator
MGIRMYELTGFQRDLLYVIEGLDRPSGQDIKDELEDYTGAFYHGRLYSNLDTVVEEGYVNKERKGPRTNYYEISEKGNNALEERRQWEESVSSGFFEGRLSTTPEGND